MLLYKYGSTQSAWIPEPLTAPKLHWLGIWPSEFCEMNFDMIKKLNEADVVRLNTLVSRKYLSEEIQEELQIMKMSGTKAEIEDFESPSRYLWEKKLMNFKF